MGDCMCMWQMRAACSQAQVQAQVSIDSIVFAYLVMYICSVLVVSDTYLYN